MAYYDSSEPTHMFLRWFLVVLVVVIIRASARIFAEYERGVILRFGRLQRIAGPGLNFIIPLIDVVYARVDTRVITSRITAERSLTIDTTPVDVNAVVFWQVIDSRRAALEVANYGLSLELAAQTALREIIGRSSLHTLLSERATIDEALGADLQTKATAWGIKVSAIEIRDVAIPEALQNAMSQKAQAEREREARIILGSAELDIAANFVAAAETYRDNPVAFALRQMNILYEGLKADNTTMIVVPSSIADSLAGIAKVKPID